ncbi:MAG: hypothetical protein FWG26_08140 [Betaproteobacteria bacterium]|nr:hypothetical protein [Betaproteobacteria bacterium]
MKTTSDAPTIQHKKNLIRSFLQRFSFGRFLASKGFDLYSTLLGSILRLGIACIVGFFLFIVFVILLFTIMFYSSSEISNSILMNSPKIFIAGFLLYQVWKIWSQVKMRVQEAKVIWRSNLLAPIILFLLFYIPFSIHHFMTVPTTELQEYGYYGACARFTEELKGGWKEFQGQKFKVQLCAKSIEEPSFGVHFGKGFEYYKVRIAIFNEQGNLQSLGYFKSGGENLFYFKIKENLIEYGDWESSSSRIIKMPPSKLEWIRARLPTLDFFND